MPEQPSQPPDDRFKAEMPQIPGVSTPTAIKPADTGMPWLVMAGLIAVLIALVVGGKVLSKSRRTEAPPAPAAQIDVPAPAPDLTPSLPVATEQDPTVAVTSDLKPAGPSHS